MFGTAVSTPSKSYTLLISMPPTPALNRFSSSPTPGTLSRMTLAGGRGCATATSVTIVPSTGGMIGSRVFCVGSSSQTL